VRERHNNWNEILKLFYCGDDDGDYGDDDESHLSLIRLRLRLDFYVV
jgi:hypothetical protein